MRSLCHVDISSWITLALSHTMSQEFLKLRAQQVARNGWLTIKATGTARKMETVGWSSALDCLGELYPIVSRWLSLTCVILDSAGSFSNSTQPRASLWLPVFKHMITVEKHDLFWWRYLHKSRPFLQGHQHSSVLSLRGRCSRHYPPIFAPPSLFSGSSKQERWSTY